MRATGVVRNLDNLGRVVIPKEIRRNFNINERDGLEIFTDGDMIILQKYKASNSCVITGEISDRNFAVAKGQLRLSPEGAEKLIQEIESHLK
ncbi:AbrB/MazE/SpoVT family DNA-binding domain-containing protein [Bacillus sp. V59.32b]|uniref:AbrB/MazE/SpoVT family DNA-binding domain-containing protein n=1 Tax=Bacillus sp. V59.32b TaxID=1758642 RepID=UPI000E3B9046|nr:AbrB/MazE/SpoVT family DNA-binding domain-containing protein [Bacillus sp. V59.32b]RFU61075.1 AbrB/MazE/SpoVT family DNA-binding domain-containing protein [Bacillus sp. V59.32b]